MKREKPSAGQDRRVFPRRMAAAGTCDPFGLIYNIGLLATPWFEGRLAQCLADILAEMPPPGKWRFWCLPIFSSRWGVQAARFIKRFYVRRFANNINRRMKGILYANLVRSRASLEQRGRGRADDQGHLRRGRLRGRNAEITTEVFDTGVALVATPSCFWYTTGVWRS